MFHIYAESINIEYRNKNTDIYVICLVVLFMLDSLFTYIHVNLSKKTSTSDGLKWEVVFRKG